MSCTALEVLLIFCPPGPVPLRNASVMSDSLRGVRGGYFFSFWKTSEVENRRGRIKAKRYRGRIVRIDMVVVVCDVVLYFVERSQVCRLRPSPQLLSHLLLAIL